MPEKANIVCVTCGSTDIKIVGSEKNKVYYICNRCGQDGWRINECDEKLRL